MKTENEQMPEEKSFFLDKNISSVLNFDAISYYDS